MKKLWIILCLTLVSIGAKAQMHNPYVDDQLVHFGFSLGINFMAYGVTCNGTPIDNLTYYARTTYMIPGLSVGFITDVRLCRHLNLRFLPNLSFGQKEIEYKAYYQDGTEKELKDKQDNKYNTSAILSLPLSLPLVLKWSAEREMNYRPYVLLGGGIDFNLNRPTKAALCPQLFDAFVTFGFGCDIYMEWFKLCPELSYKVGFFNMLTPINDPYRDGAYSSKAFYVNALDRLRNQQITLTFNFE